MSAKNKLIVYSESDLATVLAYVNMFSGNRYKTNTFQVDFYFRELCRHGGNKGMVIVKTHR